MAYTVYSERRAVTGLDGTFYVLEDAAAGVRAEVWPALGFNCLRWQVRYEGRALDLLYEAPDLFENLKPTRSGIPVLFPFPNRIRDGRFTWDGKEYRLPPNDPAGKNAIHGFACHHPWRVVGQGADAASAWVTGEFRASADGPQDLDLWPADHRIRVTYRLAKESLRVEAVVDNPDRVPLPFGLGYHPYLRVPLAPGGDPADCWVEAEARACWELVKNLPTGVKRPLGAANLLKPARRFTDLDLDDLLTDFDPAGKAEGETDLLLRGSVTQGRGGVGVRLLTSPGFRDLVVFTPPHRQAVCLEPYTCPTDAINLQRNQADTGWKVLQPGESCRAIVVFALTMVLAQHAYR